MLIVHWQTMAILLIEMGPIAGIATVHFAIQRSWFSLILLANRASSWSAMTMNTIKLLLLIMHL